MLVRSVYMNIVLVMRDIQFDELHVLFVACCVTAVAIVSIA